jgi:hypothetical protein
MPSYTSLLALGLLAAVSRAAPLVERAANKMVFAHYMVRKKAYSLTISHLT